MIRRIVSILLFILGGWMLSGELAAAFLDFKMGLAGIAIAFGAFAVFAGVPLLLAAWASPGHRWQELGLTILICVGLAAFSIISTAAIFLDPGAKQFLPPLPPIEFDFVVGTLNFAVVTVAGWLLYRSRGPGAATN